MLIVTNELQDSEFLVSEFGENDDEVKFQQAIVAYNDRMQTYPNGSIEGTVSAKNIGAGADWHWILVSITSVFFGVPKVHKMVRESLEEWRRIYNETRSLLSWLAPHRTILYPDGHLFLIAAIEISKDAELVDLVYLECMRLPSDNPDLCGLEPLLFTFSSGHSVEQVAMARHGEVLWRNTIQLDGRTEESQRPV